MKMVVGLGNPGIRYETTRHNAGFMVVDLLADQLGISISKLKNNALIGEGWLGDEKIILVKPQTYMNLSGNAVGPLFRWYKLELEDLVVIHDDLDLDLGRIRLRGKGGAGGQKGMLSIIYALGTDRITRAKIGIGRPPEGWDPVDYVLGAFTSEEWKVMQETLPKAVKAVLAVFEEGLEAAMNRYNN